MQHLPQQPEFDEEHARALVGKYVLVGIAVVDSRNNVREQQQVHGRVVDVDEATGIRVRLEGARAGEEYVLPPDLTPFYAATPGNYSLRATGEVVTDPDWLVTQTVPWQEETAG